MMRGNRARMSRWPAGQGLPAPAALIGAWYMDQYQSTPKPFVPNSAISASPPTTLTTAPRRLFSAGVVWGSTALTSVTDNFAAAPDGTTQASRVVWSNADAYLSHTMQNVPIGTYTLVAWVKSNTGVSQNFRFGFIDSVDTLFHSSTFAATTAWQKFTFTYTTTGISNLQPVVLRSVDAVTAGDFLIVDAYVVSGAVDTGADPLNGTLVVGRNFKDTTPVFANGALNVGASLGLAQFQNIGSLSQATMIVIAAKTTSTGSLSGGFGTVAPNTDLHVWTENPQADGAFLNGQFANPTAKYTGMWSFLNKGFSGFGITYDGALGNYWLDDIAMFAKSISQTPVSNLDYIAGSIVAGGSIFGTDYKIAAIAFWNTALTPAQYRQAFATLSQRAANSGNTIFAKRVLITEGDSITAGDTPGVTNGGYVSQAVASLNPVCFGFNNAVDGSAVATMGSRVAALDAMIPPVTNGRKFILSVAIGHNDMLGGGLTPAQFITALQSYLTARKAAGWKIVLGTLLPSTAAGFNANRNSVNTTIRGFTAGQYYDALADFASDATMGPDAAASNASLYSDGTHPTNAGYVTLAPYLYNAVNTL